MTLEIDADGFLYNMVRAIVGTLVEVGRGANGEDWPAGFCRPLIAAPPVPRRRRKGFSWWASSTHKGIRDW